MDQYNTLLKSIFRQIDDQKKHSISKTEWVSFLTKGNENWAAMTKEEATKLFLDVTNKFPNVTGSLLDGYLKAEAKSRCINIFRYDLHADTIFVTRNFKIKSE